MNLHTSPNQSDEPLDNPEGQPPPRFTWNAGAWFGSNVGGNLGLIVGSVQFFPQSTGIGLIWSFAYICIAGFAFYFWRSRSGNNAYTALQSMMIISGLCWLVCLGVIVFSRPELISLISGPPTTSGQRWLVSILEKAPLLTLIPLCIFPALMYLFYRLNRQNSA